MYKICLPLENDYTVAAADVVRNFSSKDFVVHQEQFKLANIANEELLEAVGKTMTSLRYGLVSVDPHFVVGGAHTFLLLP